MVYEYVLAAVLVSLLSSVFFVFVNTTYGDKKDDDVANVSATGVFLTPEIEKSTDVVIVGAGVAGAALAYTLGKVIIISPFLYLHNLHFLVFYLFLFILRRLNIL
ncbi:hypothetical protein C1H46_044782 [Malus baccata]|uniref:Squalene monooxygenase n=1 Tax=Malus baccata TaxID=106549 RepID=A0A540K638_MALBA|nr:hypothetical protein C1H46_044782 [Malus baccata]